MALTLHWSPRSPYVRKAMVALHEKGLMDQVSIIRTAADPLIPHEGLMQLNPLSKIPTLEREGQSPLWDSRVIMEWADLTGTSGPQLFPADPEQRLQVLTLEAVGNGLLDIALPWLVEIRMRPEAARYQPQIDAYRRKSIAVFDWLEANITSISTSGFNAGQLAIGVALKYFDFRFEAEGWRKNRPLLTAWFDDSFSQRPSVLQTEFRDDPRPLA
ncbi:glutathione S-transferase family protein [Pseudogemmobacter faecipullorum]|uniref:Glutathione S-transferase family protein n=1 Tax=Pseudogemmobacter faecipullorum TaxID=2755041 RepID=A0ABS8CNJ8_9RHOB|nr:glutathione S-transferase family protein [Pseudogemmobacter faecipullorum]MCB5410921.1 glutathione S-transferase family protein [Pseudogemmobacter faecipullorum]